MGILQRAQLILNIGGWKYFLLKVEDKLTGSCKAAPYLDEYKKNVDVAQYPRMLKAMYKRSTGKDLDLDNPRSFNEKIQWMKLYDSTPIKTRLADKYLVREWVTEKIGEEYLIPLLGVWDSFDEIDFDKLPQQFVLKCNHGSGANIIVKDKSKIDKPAMKEQFEKWMATDYSLLALELHYRNIPRKIIAESYIEQMDNNLLDYKIHVFNGEPKIIEIIGERDLVHHTAKECFLTPEWRQKALMYHTFDLYDVIPEKPRNIDDMLRIASILGEGFPYVRVDLYNIEGKILFGEMTFTPRGGFGKWSGDEEYLVGSWIDLKK